MNSYDELIRAAQAVRAHSYSPYSHYPVGAALQTRDGRTFVGTNVEDASWLTICAERAAICAAVAAGSREIAAIVVVTASSPPAAPCGACRQYLAEFADDSVPIVLINDRGERRDTTVGELLPLAFRTRDLATP
jgi:cytidine deaminase